jgi:hypothetical protein
MAFKIRFDLPMARMGRPVTENTIMGATPVGKQSPQLQDGSNDPAFPFQPGAPITPITPPGSEPIQWAPPVEYNKTYSPDKKPWGRYAQNASIADNCYGIRVAMNQLKKELRGCKWKIAKKREKPTWEKDTETPESKALTFFLKKPDRKVLFSDWVSAGTEDILKYGSLALGKLRSLDGTHMGLRRVHAADITPIVTAAGVEPDPPNPAYYHYLYGQPYRWYTAEEFIWRPFDLRNDTPYGYSAIDAVLSLATLSIQKSLYLTAQYTFGNVPPGFLGCPASWTEERIAEFQEYLNDLMEANPLQQVKALAVPADFKWEPAQQHPAYQYDFDEHLMRIFCWVVGVSPNAIAKATGFGSQDESWESGAESGGIVPFKQFFEEILDAYITDDLGSELYGFTWIQQEKSDAVETQKLDVERVSSSIMTVNEARERAGLPPSDDPDASILGGKRPEPVPQLALPGKVAGEEGPEAKNGERGGVKAGPKGVGEGEGPPPKPEGKGAVKKVDVVLHPDILTWKRKVKNDINAGRDPRPFETSLPDAAIFMVKKALEAGDVQKAFEKPGEILRFDEAGKHKHLWANGKEAAQRYLSFLWTFYRDEVITRVEKADALPKAPLPDPDVWSELENWLKDLYEAAARDAADVVGAGAGSEAAALYARHRAGALIGKTWNGEKWVRSQYTERLSDSVREDFQAILEDAIRAGKSSAEIAKDLRDLFPDAEDYRLKRIARTEAVTAYNMGALASFLITGCEYVEVSDGTEHEPPYECECLDVDGEIWTIEKAMENPLAHPNCTRGFIPRPDLK